MVKRILAIIAIYAVTAVAWAILGATIFQRTYGADRRLRGNVEATWGAPQRQRAPTATVEKRTTRQVRSEEDGRTVVRTVQDRDTIALPLEQSRVRVGLDLAHRQKGLLWYSTYRVAFAGDYLFRNTTAVDSVTVALPLPAAQAIYDDLVLTVDGAPVPFHAEEGAVTATIRLAPGATARLGTGYRSQGLTDWRYDFGGKEVSQVRDFELTMRTNFDDIDFASDMLSPTEKRRADDGWLLTWRYRNLLSGYQLGMVMPEKLQPGPLAGRISLFAPVSLLFFFLLMFVLTTLRGIDLHPMNYFFLAASFFSFHLLLAYLADHVSIHAAFLIASATSILLTVTYLRLVVDLRFALREAAIAQLVFLVLFSYAFFFEGFTGLTVTVGSILTLFFLMQLTGRVRWSERFAAAERRVPAHA